MTSINGDTVIMSDAPRDTPRDVTSASTMAGTMLEISKIANHATWIWVLRVIRKI